MIRPRAQQNAGDQRINSFGVGGEIEVRSGLLVQKQVLTGAPVHFGLGTHTAIDVARIVWPNGVRAGRVRRRRRRRDRGGAAAEGIVPVGVRVGRQPRWASSPTSCGDRRSACASTRRTRPASRRRKTGSGSRGDQLAPRDGAYDVRITAELWETHFFDHVSLLVVDHPADTEVFVDERFSPAHPPALASHVDGRRSRRSRAPGTSSGRDVTDLVTRRDGRYLATFERGAYQGIAQEHFVEFELARRPR